MTSIKVPNSVTSIEGYAFSGCQKLTDIYCYSEKVPNTYANAFQGSCIENVTLHVPVGLLDNYKNAIPWSNCQTIVALDQIKGDANSDNSVDADDITELANAIVGMPSIIYKNEAADINNDGKVDVSDLAKLIEILLKRQ